MKKILLKFDNKFCMKIFFGLLFWLTFLRYGLEINIPVALLLFVSFLIVTFGNISEIMAMCLCCIPLHTSFEYLYVLLYGCVVLFLKNFKKIRINYIVIIIVIIVLWELLHSINDVFMVKQLVALMTPYALVLSLHFCRKMKIDYYYISMMFARFVALLGTNLLSRTLKTYGENFFYGIEKMGRLGVLEETAIVGGQINPNSMGVLCVIAITMLLQNYLYIKKETKSILYVLVIFIIGMLTLSKTYIVLLVLSGTLLIVGQKNNNKQKASTMVIIALIILLGGTLLFNVFPTVVEAFIERWNTQDLSSGRFTIMQYAVKALEENRRLFWFGIGLQNYHEKVYRYAIFPPHNVFHEIIFVWGLPGLILFTYFVLSLINEAKKVNKHFGIVNLIPLIIIIAKAVAGHWITSNYTMLTIPLLYLSMLYDFYDSENL